jgi:hypothetical protein
VGVRFRRACPSPASDGLDVRGGCRTCRAAAWPQGCWTMAPDPGTVYGVICSGYVRTLGVREGEIECKTSLAL